MTPDDRWIDRARFDADHANRVWAGSADIEDAPAWYGRVATLLRAAPAPATADELATESEIVARMQAAILDPAPPDELAAESDIVTRMQAVILESAWAADGDGVRDGDLPRHLRAAAGGRDGARRRRGARVVRRIVAVKAAAVTTVVAIGVTAAAATTGIVATVVVPALSSHEPPAHEEPQTRSAPEGGSSSDGSGETDHGVGDGSGGDEVITFADEPVECILDLDCLVTTMQQAAAAPDTDPGPTVSVPEDPIAASDPVTVDPETVVTEPTPPTTEPPPTTTTTEPPPTTTTTEPPPTTTTTEPPPDPPAPEQAAPPSPPETVSASAGGSGAVEVRAAGRAELPPAG
jgi:hypothetical protein